MQICGHVFCNLAQHSILHTPEAISFLAISLASSGAWEISAGASEENILHMLTFSLWNPSPALTSDNMSTTLFCESGGIMLP